jgi:phosphoglycolate phosphatase
MIKLVLVDFDDTLCLSEEACFHLENEIAARLKLPPMTRATHQANWGKPLKEAIVERIPGVNPDAFMDLFVEVSHKHVMEGKFDHVSEENLEVLRNLRKAGYTVCILTSRLHVEVQYLISDASSLKPIIDGFFYQERFVYKKPDPRVFELPMRVFDVPFHEMVYVGDAFMDVQWCRAAGVHFIASIESGLRNQDDFKKLGAKWFISKFTQLPERIAELNRNLETEPRPFTSKSVL